MLKTKTKAKPHKKPKANPTPPLTPEQRADKRQREKMKDRAAILSIEQIDASTYRVWGGQGEHILRIHARPVVPSGLTLAHISKGWITCDCPGWITARNHNCSHITKFRLVYGDLKKASK